MRLIETLFIQKLSLNFIGLFFVSLAFGQSENLFKKSHFKVRCEPGVTALTKKIDKSPYIIVTSAPSSVTPAIYFGSLNVLPGRTYTYLITGRKKDASTSRLYVTTNGRNIIWPGATFKNGIAVNTFVVPDNVSEVTLALAFEYPQKIDTLYLENIGLFEGNLTSWPTGIPTTDFEIIFDNKNLVTAKQLKIHCEDGVTASLKQSNGKNYLDVRSAPSEKDPSIYLATIDVTPERDYTYIIKATKQSSGKCLLYVTSPKGNLVWPGDELRDGIAKNSFRVPKEINEIILAVTFSRPQKKESILIEDLALFSGYVENWDPEDPSVDFSSAFTGTSYLRWWLLVGSFVILFAIFYSYDSKPAKINTGT